MQLNFFCKKLKGFHLFLVLEVLMATNQLHAQEIRIRNIDEKEYPTIKIEIEYIGQRKFDFSKLIVLEPSDTIDFSIDSLPDKGNSKSVCLLISTELLNNPGQSVLLSNLIKEITGNLSKDDLLDIILTTNKTGNKNCIEPISYEFSNDFKGLTEFFKSSSVGTPSATNSPLSGCALEQSIAFMSEKATFPSERILLVCSRSPENMIKNITEIKEKANRKRISMHWLSLDNEKQNDPKFLRLILDSLFLQNKNISYDNKIYLLKFHSKQNREINQFEIDYKGEKIRSTFTSQGNRGFLKDNFVLVLIIVIFLVFIILLLLNFIFIKRQIKLSMDECRAILVNNNLKDIDKNKIKSQSNLFGAISKLNPFITIEIEGIKKDYELNKAIIKIGRDSENDIVIDNLTISHLHATITFEEGQFFIQDNLSTNGTFVNDTKISKIPIKNGDILRLGKARVLVTY